LSYRAPASSRLATLGIGYADGWPHVLGNRGAVFHRGIRIPIVGRLSMDSMTVDISDLAAGSPTPGDQIELIGPHQSVAEVAADAGTIPYEILTRLGRRFAREWLA
jgi:alanine racemase